MICGSFDSVEQSQGKVAGLSMAAKQHVDEAERALGARDCWRAMDALVRARTALATLSFERQAAGLTPEGPFSAGARRRLGALDGRFTKVCIG